MTDPQPEPLDPTIVHPEPDTSANEGVDGGPPPTWDPGKVTQPPPPPPTDDESDDQAQG